MIVSSNKRVSEWAELFGDEVQAVAIVDRLLHDAEVLTINGPSWRLRGRTDILKQQRNDTQNGENSSTDTPRHPRPRTSDGRTRRRLNNEHPNTPQRPRRRGSEDQDELAED
jgi:hypothetical protein